MKRKWDFPLYLYDGTVAYVLVTDAAERIHQAFETGRRAAMAEVGIPTTQPILEAAVRLCPFPLAGFFIFGLDDFGG